MLYWTQPWPQLAFDARRWKADKAEFRTPRSIRHRMGESVVRMINGRFKGSNRQVIEQILGKADFELGNKTSKFDDEDATGEKIGAGEIAIGWSLWTPRLSQKVTQRTFGSS